MKSMKLMQRCALLAVVICAAVPSLASAQTVWPSRPVKLMVPFAPGGGNDVISRALSTKLGARLGQSFIIENRGGAGGIIGTDAVAKAAADGYTLLFASTSISTASAGGNKLPYDIKKDLEPIGQIGATPLILVVAANSKYKTLRDLIDAARAKPNAVSYGSGGVGSMSHLGIELVAAEAKVHMLHVPYKGLGVAFNDMLGGSLDVAISSMASSTQLIAGGKLRALAVTSLQRSPFMPDMPTTSEAGLAGFQIEFWWGLLAPARSPPAIVKRLNEELNGILGQSDMRDLLAREAAVPMAGTPESFAKLIAFEMDRWSKLIKDANIKME